MAFGDLFQINDVFESEMRFDQQASSPKSERDTSLKLRASTAARL